MIYKVITGRLLQYEAFDNLVKGRLFPVIIPQTRTFPAVTYNVISSTPDKTKDEDVQDTIDFQLDIYSEKYDIAYDILNVIRDRLNHFKGEINGVTVKESRLDSFRDGIYDEETGVIQVTMSFFAKIKL